LASGVETEELTSRRNAQAKHGESEDKEEQDRGNDGAEKQGEMSMNVQIECQDE